MAIFWVFFFSGAASLVYELVWMRHLTLIFGATSYAVSTILSIFMGGLALGSLAFGRFSDRLARTLYAYAAIEVAIGPYALFVPQAFESLRGRTVPSGLSLFGNIPEHEWNRWPEDGSGA